MIKTKNKNLIFVIFFVSMLIYSNVSFSKIEYVKNILSHEDTKIYKQIFEIQRLPIKNKASKEWEKVDGLIKKIETLGETSIFDTNVTNHHHFMDEETGELIDFSSDNISLRSCPKTPYGYKRNGLDIIIKIKKVESSTLK